MTHYNDGRRFEYKVRAARRHWRAHPTIDQASEERGDKG